MSVFSKKSNSNSNHSFSSKDKNEDAFFGVQAKLNIGKSNDKYEVEADSVADKIVSNSQKKTSESFFNPTPIVQKKSNEIQRKEEEVQANEEEEIQSKIEEKEVQMNTDGDINPTVDSNLENNLNSSKGSGSPLPENTKTEMESGFGTDFSNVRIHKDSNAVQMNKELGAQAFASGNHIYFNEGKFNPDSQDGKHLLAHELTHTVQQGTSQPVIQKQEEEGEEANNSSNETDITQENPTVENDSTKNTSSEETQAAVTNGPNNNTVSTENNQSTSDSTTDSANQFSTQNTVQDESTSETNLGSGGGGPINQSTDVGGNKSSTDDTTSSTTVASTSEATSSSGGSSETGGGFATYNLFLAYVEEKKQASVEYFKNKKQELTDGINEEKRKNKETIQTEIDRLKETKRATLEKINKSYDQATNAIKIKRDNEIQKARDNADAEIIKVDEVILTKTELITSIAEDKAQRVISTGSEQSTLALKTTSGNIKQVDAIIQQKQSQYSGKDNAGDIIQAAWESKPDTVQKIQESGDIISSEVVSHSLKLADNYRTEATTVSSEFGNKKQEAVDAIIERRDEIITAVTDAAKESLTGLDEETTNLKTELEESVNSQIIILETIPTKIDSELDDILKTTLVKVNENETTTLQEIDQFKNDIEEIYWYNEEVSEAQNDLGKAIDEHHTDVDKYIKEVIKKVTAVSTEFKTEFISTQNTINSALSETASGYQESADKLKTDTIKSIDDSAREGETETKKIADGLDAGLQEKIDESDTKWNSQLTEDITNMRETVSSGLLQQTEILSQFTANLDEEFNRSRSWWDDVTDFISGMAAGFVEGFTSLMSALWDAMGTLIFWVIVLIVVIIIVVLVVVFKVALATILAVLLVIGIVVAVILAIYFIYKAVTTEGLTPYERGRLFGRALFEIAFALIGVGVYTRLAGWIARIGRISSIIARVGSMARFLRIVVRVKDVRAFIALLDTMADIEKLLLLMDKIKDVGALIKILSSADDAARIIEVLLAVGKADDLLRVLSKADDIAEILTLIERGIQLGHAESLITILAKTQQLAKLLLVLGRSGDDFGRVVNLLSGAGEMDKMIIAMERVGAANLGRLITLLETATDTAALIRIVTKAADFGTLLRIVEEATDVNKIITLFDKVTELDKLVIAFDSFRDTNRLLAVFDLVTDTNKLVTLLGRSSALDRLVPFLEGLADINAALPKLEALGTELDDFVKLLDEAGMTIGKLEKILFYENLTVTKFKDLLAKAGGIVDDLILVLDEIRDLKKLSDLITHFGDFLKVKTLVEKAKTSGMIRAVIVDFFDACLTNGYKKLPELEQFFDKVVAHGASTTVWRETLGYGANFVSESSGNITQFAGRSASGSGSVASKNFVLANGSNVTVTVEIADINHMASRHTWNFFAMVLGNAKTSNSMWPLGTDLNAVRTMAINALNSPEVSAKISTMLSGGNDLVTVGINEARIALNGPNGIVSMYPTVSGTVDVPKKLMQAAILLWKSR